MDRQIIINRKFSLLQLSCISIMLISMTKTIDLLKKSGLRTTAVREAVIKLLIRHEGPLTHQEIIEAKSVAEFDRVTIYRTLDSLHKATLLHKVLGEDNVWRFCLHHDELDKKCGGNHIHFLCRECKKMSCLKEQPLPWIAAPKGARIESKQLVVQGLCAKCLSKGKK